MHFMVSGGQGRIADTRTYSVVDFVRVKADERVDSRRRSLPKKTTVPEPVPNKPQRTARVTSNTPVNMAQLTIEAPPIDGIKVQSGLFLGSFIKQGQDSQDLAGLPDGDVQPLLRIAPQYPRRAAIKGVEGWVKIAFTIQGDGTVSDPQVINAKPSRIFNRAALTAIKKWKFRPRMVDGKAVPRKAEQVIEFSLAK